jgi:hypothetical protein
LQFTRTQLGRIESIERRAKDIIGPQQDGKVLAPIVKTLHKQSCTIVRKCLDGQMCSNFNNYFQINETGINTRNANCLLKLPKVKLDFAKQSFFYSGAKIYNDLPIDIRKEVDFNKFLKKFEHHFQ